MSNQHRNPDAASGPAPDDLDGLPDLDAYVALEEIGSCLTRLASVRQDRLDPLRRRTCAALGELISDCDEADVPLTSAAPDQVPYPLLTHLIFQTAPEEVIEIAQRRAASDPGDDFHTIASWLASVTRVGGQ